MPSDGGGVDLWLLLGFENISGSSLLFVEPNVEAAQALFGLETCSLGTYSLELQILNCANNHWTQAFQSADPQCQATDSGVGEVISCLQKIQ